MKEYTLAELTLLSGEEFNSILAKDEILAELEKQKYDPAKERNILLEVLGMISYRIGKLPILPLTAAKFAFLSMLKSPFIHGGECSMADLDLVLYILSCPDLRELNCEIPALPAAASGFAEAAALPVTEVMENVKELFSTSFYLLSLLPEEKSKGGKKNGYEYDALWLTFLTSLAARESGMDLMYCMHKMSLSSLCAFYVNYCKRESTFADNIRRRLPEDVQNEMEARVDLLAEEFLKNTVRLV